MQTMARVIIPPTSPDRLVPSLLHLSFLSPLGRASGPAGFLNP